MSSSSFTPVFLSRASHERPGPERLKDICQKQDVGAAVQVAIVSQGLAPKGRQDLLRMVVVFVTDMHIGELAVEGFLWGSLGSVK